MAKPLSCLAYKNATWWERLFAKEVHIPEFVDVVKFWSCDHRHHDYQYKVYFCCKLCKQLTEQLYKTSFVALCATLGVTTDDSRVVYWAQGETKCPICHLVK